MSLGLAFYILMLLWAIGAFWWRQPQWPAAVPDFLLFILILLLGWHAFGAPIHG